jgi:hypothetical protein
MITMLGDGVEEQGYARGHLDSLTPSAPLAYPHVVSRRFTYFRAVKFSVYAGQPDFCSGFDCRQLH